MRGCTTVGGERAPGVRAPGARARVTRPREWTERPDGLTGLGAIGPAGLAGASERVLCLTWNWVRQFPLVSSRPKRG
jgi:hypothetical protein